MPSPRTKRTPRKKPAQQRSRETVRAIVTAAARILSRDGYEKTNVNHVAELAGVSIGSLYQYFPSKEALVAEVARVHSQQMLDAFRHDIVDFAFVPMRDAVRGVVARAVRAFRIDPRLRAVILEEMPRNLYDTGEFDETFDQALRLYFEYHRERIRPQNIDLAILVLRSSVEAVAGRSAVRGDAEDEVIEELFQLAYSYLARER
jgi:AcrR family transcriptional regulator